jgi:hypothetical protein
MCLRRGIEARVVQATPRHLCALAVPPEHDSRSFASIYSFHWSRRASPLCTPPPRAFGVRAASSVSRQHRRTTTAPVLGAAPLGPPGSPQANDVTLTVRGPGVLAMPGMDPLRLHGATSRGRPSSIRPTPLPLPALRFGPVSAKPPRAAAHLTSACSGLAALAADARR